MLLLNIISYSVTLQSCFLYAFIRFPLVRSGNYIPKQGCQWLRLTTLAERRLHKYSATANMCKCCLRHMQNLTAKCEKQPLFSPLGKRQNSVDISSAILHSASVIVDLISNLPLYFHENCIFIVRANYYCTLLHFKCDSLDLTSHLMSFNLDRD